MTVDHQLERSMLDGKDREELHAIAGAMGVKAATRMRKADLVDAILAAVNGGASGTGSTPASTPASVPASVPASAEAATDAPAKPRRVRSARASTLTEDPVAALAAEEESLATDEEPPPPRPVRRSRATNGAAAETATDATSTPSDPDDTTSSATSTLDRSGKSPNGDAPSHGRGTDARRSYASTDTAATERGGADASGSDGADAGSATEASTSTTTAQPGSQGDGARPRDDDDRGSYEGNRRRRRRRGRDRTFGSEPGQSQPSEPLGEPIDVQGLLDLRDEGYGFLRSTGYLPGQKDVYVSASQVRRFALRKGDFVKGQTRPPASNEKYPALLRVDEINGMAIEEARDRPRFEDLTPLFPDEKLALELVDDPQGSTGRIIDLISPIGKGQRGLIVSPPKAGKTTIMKQIVYSIERNNPEVHLMVLLVDERPEEVTDMRRHVLRGEVVASTFDRPSEEHTHVAELTIERAKRLVELGRDVVIVLDGITRLARAYNLATPASGRILSGGVDSTALYPPKRFFGAARNVEEGGSLTILATALVETGSRMDEVIFEEFKGTGNMELRLDRRLAERRIYPAIDVEQSSTRHEELLFQRDTLQQVWKLRRVLNGLEGGAGLELLIDKIRTTRSNDEFMAEISKAPV